MFPPSSYTRIMVVPTSIIEMKKLLEHQQMQNGEGKCAILFIGNFDTKLPQTRSSTAVSRRLGGSNHVGYTTCYGVRVVVWW